MLALKYIERLNACTTEPEKKAFCYLSMGQLLEQNRDFDAAISAYSQAYLLEPVYFSPRGISFITILVAA